MFYSSADTTFGFTTINDISGAGFFTVHAAPYIKNEICHANKYIKKVSLEQIRNALVGMRVPPNEEFLWQSWLALQSEMEQLSCQTQGCKHTFKQLKFDQLVKEMQRCGTTSNGWIMCRPCAEYNNLVAKKSRPAPYAGGGAQAVVPPWRSSQTVFDQTHAKFYNDLQARLAAVAALPEAEQEEARQKITQEALFCSCVKVL